jgi:hypothetical protein
MKTIRTKVYQFSELKTALAKQNAIEWFLTGNQYFSTAWEDTKEDAKQIGLKLISLDDHRQNEGEFMLSANEVAQNILNEHGAECETYKTTAAFMEEWQPVFNEYMTEPDNALELETKLMDIENDFLTNLLEDYRIMLNNQIDYESSNEYAIDMIEANEYDFTADGKRFNQ